MSTASPDSTGTPENGAPLLPGGSTPEGRQQALAGLQAQAEAAMVVREEQLRLLPVRPSFDEDAEMFALREKPTRVPAPIHVTCAVLGGVAAAALAYCLYVADYGEGATPLAPGFLTTIKYGLFNLGIFAVLAVALVASAVTSVIVRSRRWALVHFVAVVGGAGFSAWVLYGFQDLIGVGAPPFWPGFAVAVVAATARLVVHLSALQMLKDTWARGRSVQRQMRYGLLPAEHVLRRVWSTPGQGTQAVSRYGADKVAMGVYGEQYVAALLERISATDPLVRVFHQVKFPGSRSADIDHVIVRGSKSVLVDAKAWRQGHYSWSMNEPVLLRDGQTFDGAATKMPDAAQLTAKALEGVAAFPAAYILLAPSKTSGQVSTTDNTWAPPGAVIAAPEEGERWIREYLFASDEDAYLDRALLAYWHQQLK